MEESVFMNKKKVINFAIVSAVAMFVLQGNVNFYASAVTGKAQKVKQSYSSVMKKSKAEKKGSKKKNLKSKNKKSSKVIKERISKLRKQLSKLEDSLKKIEGRDQIVHSPEERKDQKSSAHSWTWPVPGYSKILSGFCDVEGRSHSHGAIDIGGSGIYGATVVAANSGTVTQICTDDRGGGYGNYVIIDHGNGKSTLYAHLSTVSVTEGQKVSAGQKIGNAGNTGFSTGPHLHFEYRVNGVRTNPAEILDY